MQFEFTQEMHDADMPHWIATLSDGNKVYQDDYLTNGNSWAELRNYCIDNDLYLTGFGIKFRSGYKELPNDKEGYFFRKKLLGWIGVDGSMKRFKNSNYFIIGYLEDDIVTCWHYRVPELIYDHEDTRHKDSELVGESLIAKI